ncbi:hypothetical protein AB5J62_06375 [Amycolatopsis sp. cg5]|uniref:hypothetical protein n=1 Tax=Amycolatopsis sp. cg5 TaxID=3238802 RepID=UPI003523EA16
MAGRHSKKPVAWKLPTGIATSVTAGLALTFWLTSGPGGEAVANGGANMALQAPLHTAAPTTSSSVPSSSATPTPTSTPSPTTTEQPKTSAPVKKAPPPKECSTSLSGTKPYVAQVGNHVKAKFGIDEVGGVASRSGASDHPSGLALDFMVDTATGNQVADYVLANQKDFGVSYVIWRQRYNDGSGWDTMEDRGGATANHMDHVHVSFKSGAKVDVSC